MESFVPLVTDTSVRVTLVMSLYYSKEGGVIDSEWIEEMIDVEAASLNSQLDKDIYIELPKYLNEYCGDKGVLLLEDPLAKVIMSQYGLVQAARLWFGKFVEILTQEEACGLMQ